MGGEQHGAVLAVGTYKFADFNELVRVETGGGLVEDEDLGVVDEGLRDADTLFEAARQRPDFLVLFRRESGAFHDLIHAFPFLFQLEDSGNKLQELTHIHVVVERVGLGEVADNLMQFLGIFPDVETADSDIALRGRDQSGDDLHHGGLAGAVRPQKTDNLSFFRFKTDLVEGVLLPKNLGDVVDYY